MPKLKIAAKKIEKFDIEPNDLATAIAENWAPNDIANLLSGVMHHIGYEGKESQVIEVMLRYGYRETLEAWSKGLPA